MLIEMWTTGPAPGMVGEIKKPLTLAFLFLAILGWLAAALSFWNKTNGYERPRTAEIEVGEDHDKVLAQVNAAQQKLATVQSALSVTTRLRDESAEALQEVRARSAQVRKELALASNQLDDIQQTIAIRNAELTTMSTRVETGRLRETQEKRKTDSSAAAGTPKPLAAETVTSNTKESTESTRATKGEPTEPDIQVDHGVPSTVVNKNAADRDQQQAATQVEAMQKKLATVKSALAMTTRLRDEAAQALAEIRSRSAGVKKDLSAARDQLNAVEQQITARNSELLSMSKQPDTARLQETRDKQERDASPNPAAATNGGKATTVANVAKEKPTPAAKDTVSASPNTALPPASAAAAKPAVAAQRGPNRTEVDARSIARSSPPTAASPEPSPAPGPTPTRKARKVTETHGASAVIGPGDSSPPSAFERYSGRVSRTP
jgi:hypothetical protein